MKNKSFKIFSQNYIKIFFAFCLLITVCLSSCKKEQFNTKSSISFSNDTLTFDTVFTTLGSTTRFFTIRNTEKQPLKISSIKLAGGASSSYRINVDGDAGTEFANIEIPSKDSIYVFVEVTVDPNAANLPFVLMDSVQVLTNGIDQQVILQAYGQNAHFYDGDTICNEVWNNDLPHVILNYVVVKEGCSLTINQGCNVYFGGGAAMIVEGDLSIQGMDTSNMVTFRGIRLDKDIANRPYDDFPGQYSGLFFLRGSTGNIQYLKMRNSAYGINVGNIKTTDNDADNIQRLKDMKLANAPVVTIENSKIYNHAFYGIFGFLGKINAKNVLVYNCGKNVVGLYNGGEYSFINCTFYTRGTAYISHAQEPLFYMNNYFTYDISQPALYADSSKADFINCILYGTLNEEIVLEEAAANPNKINISFNHTVLKTKLNLSGTIFSNCSSDDPQFFDVFKSNFKLKGTSPCIDFSTIPFTTTDIDGFSITGSKRDCGAYEFQ